jgi:hypothetical protein
MFLSGLREGICGKTKDVEGLNMTKFPLSTLVLSLAMLLTASPGWTQMSSGDASTGFPPLDQWRNAVLAGDASALKAFYSIDPPAKIDVRGGTIGADADVNFWLGLKARSMKLEIVRLKQKPGGEGAIFKAEVQRGDGQILNITYAEGWRQQGDQWRITGAERTDSPHLAQPSDMKKNLYPADVDARAEIKEAEEKAGAEHKRVLLQTGATTVTCSI